MTNFTKTHHGVQFLFTFTPDGGGGDFVHNEADGDLNTLSLDTNDGTIERVTIKRSDGNGFVFNSIYIDNSGGSNASHSVNVTGKLSGGDVETQVMSFGNSGTLTFNGGIGIAVDEIELTAGGFEPIFIDNFSGTVAAVNTPPTASSFTAPNGPYENLTYTFSTSDFGYSDGDGDILDHVLIESTPTAGTLFVDADNDDAFDGGEAVSVNDHISKTDLDAGNLQYIQNGSVNTSFQFEVSDGTESSSGNYVAILNVAPVPTVTLSLSPTSKSESVTTNSTVTATLSNFYGMNTSVGLGFSGTATGSGVDYSVSGTSIMIPAGSTTGSISLNNVPDALYEGNETVIMDIISVSGGIENGTQQVTYTITDDDSPPNATLEVLPIYNPITDESGGEAYVRGKIDAVAGVNVSIPLSFSGTAIGGGTDYSVTGTVITISPGQVMDSIRVTSLFDEIEEGDETVIIDMGTPTNAVEDGTQQVTLTIKDEDATPPSGYAVGIDQTLINMSNESAVSFTFTGAEVGATYNYTVSSSGGGTTVTGSGSIATATGQIAGIDLSGLGDGTITLSVTLTDTFGSTGIAATDTKSKDTAAPSGYSVTIDQSGINASNQSGTSFTFAGAEVGTTYNYTFSSSGGGTNVTGSGTLATATDQITGVDLSGLGDGNITLSVTLTDTFGNTGSAATDTQTKDATVPSGYTVAMDLFGESVINATNESILEFSATGLEVGSTLHYAFSSSGGGTPVTGTETVTSLSEQFDNGGAGYDLSGLPDGTVTLTVYLSDPAGNQGANTVDTAYKGALVATITDQSDVSCNGGNDGGLTVEVTNGTAPYNYVWSNGSTTNSSSSTSNTITGLQAGNYTVTVTDGNALVATASVTVAEPVALAATITSQTHVSCSGGSDGEATVMVTGGTGPYDYVWSNGANTATATGLSEGTYGVTITDDNSCTTSTSVTITGTSVTVQTSAAASVNFGSAILGGELLTGSGCAQESGVVFATTTNPDLSDSKQTMALVGDVFSGTVNGLEINTTYYARAYNTNINGVTSYGNEITFTTAQKILDITVTPNQTKVYGTTDPVLTYTADGFEGGDDITILTGTLSRAVGENVGAYTVEQGTLDAGSNYVIHFISADFQITQAVLTVTADDNSKTYGETDPALTVSYSGFVNGDDVTSLGGALVVDRASGEDAGNYAITVSGYSSSNYMVDYVAGDFEISPAVVSILVDSGQSKLFGTADPVFSYTASGFTNGDSEGILTGTLQRAVGEDVGTYPIEQGSLDAGPNYSISFIGALFEITSSQQQITWDQEFNFDCGAAEQIILTATSDSGLPVRYRVANTEIATVEGNILTVHGSGSTTLTAYQEGNDTYSAASEVVKALSIGEPGLIRRQWDDVLVFDNSSERFVAWQWYKNGSPVPGATKQYYAEEGGVDGTYYVEATDRDGNRLTSCPLDISGQGYGRSISIVPNPVKRVTDFTLQVDFDQAWLEGASISIYDLTGREISSTDTVTPQTMLKAPQQPGIYVVILNLQGRGYKTANLLVN
ncbi:MAG: hypothetical protein NXH90_16700 [Flavobacteriaceae bacterium]|nr:hypothetical protein [Flavobacteriaceae bacterium]